MYAQMYFSEEDFWRDFDNEWYNTLREKYHAETLPTVYEKVRVDVEAEKLARANAMMKQKFLSTWPVSGVFAIRRLSRVKTTCKPEILR